MKTYLCALVCVKWRMSWQFHKLAGSSWVYIYGCWVSWWS